MMEGRLFNGSRSTQALAALNVALLACLLVGGLTVFRDMGPRLQRAQRLVGFATDGFDTGSAFLLGETLNNVANTFVFGALNGSVPQFLGDMMRAGQYVSLAAALESFSSGVMQAFDGSPPGICEDTITCPSPIEYPTPVVCASGKVVLCQYQGQVLSCANETCIASYVYSVASMVNTVSSIVTRLSNNGSQASNSDAAFDDGLLNVEAATGWVEAQANPYDWRGAGRRCLDFAARVRSVTWSGEYVDFNGVYRDYNVSKDVNHAVRYVEQVCNNLISVLDNV